VIRTPQQPLDQIFVPYFALAWADEMALVEDDKAHIANDRWVIAQCEVQLLSLPSKRQHR